MARGDERLAGVRTDEARCAGHQNMHDLLGSLVNDGRAANVRKPYAPRLARHARARSRNERRVRNVGMYEPSVQRLRVARVPVAVADRGVVADLAPQLAGALAVAIGDPSVFGEVMGRLDQRQSASYVARTSASWTEGVILTTSALDQASTTEAAGLARFAGSSWMVT